MEGTDGMCVQGENVKWVAPILKRQRLDDINNEKSQEEFMSLSFKLLTKTAQTPTYGSEGAAGMDLYASMDCIIPPKGRALISTGIAMAIPNGYYGQIAPRSGIAVKNGIHTGAGIVDQDYRGEVKVLLFNLGESDFQVVSGDRIAQMIIKRYICVNLVKCELLDGTARGTGGFGSTGLNGDGAATNGTNGTVINDTNSASKMDIQDEAQTTVVVAAANIEEGNGVTSENGSATNAEEETKEPAA